MRIPDRRIDRARRQILARMRDPVLIMFARGNKRPKEIALVLVSARLAELRKAGDEDGAERLYRAKVRWVERRIMRAL